jgi:hypothetical protein
MPGTNTCAVKKYRTRDPEASPFFALVRDYFDEFEQIYPEQFQNQYGYWRPVIRDSIDKFLKCGDLTASCLEHYADWPMNRSVK